MRKIPTVFVRDFSRDHGRYVLDQITPGCEWVFAGEGTPTRKYDGTCMRYDEGRWWARREVKAGKGVPAGFLSVSTDETTGKTVGWEPVEHSGFEKFFRDAVDAADGATFNPGTYELIGPKINGNPERRSTHALVAHANAEQLELPALLDFETVRHAVLSFHNRDGCEGIVWYGADGRMAKIKARDFRTTD